MRNRDWDDWIAQYATSHTHRVNRLCHLFGIPMIVISLVLFVLAPMVSGLWLAASALFLVGWALQFIGHFVEGKPPEFFSDWRFLFVGVRWWWAKIRGRV